MSLEDVINLLHWVEAHKTTLMAIRRNRTAGYASAVGILCAYDALKEALYVINAEKDSYEKKVGENA